MGRCYFHSTEVVWELIAQEEWLGCRHNVAHEGHTRVNTSVGSMNFSVLYIKLMYMYNVFKNLYVVQKEHWWTLTSSWSDEVQRVFSTAQ